MARSVEREHVRLEAVQEAFLIGHLRVVDDGERCDGLGGPFTSRVIRPVLLREPAVRRDDQ
eukprot:511557-Pyramimonas_sp.AAC.1